MNIILSPFVPINTTVVIEVRWQITEPSQLPVTNLTTTDEVTVPGISKMGMTGQYFNNRL